MTAQPDALTLHRCQRRRVLKALALASAGFAVRRFMPSLRAETGFSDESRPANGSFLTRGVLLKLPGQAARHQLTFPVYEGFTYEVTLEDAASEAVWNLLPFALTLDGPLEHSRQTAAEEKTLTLYLAPASPDGIYRISFRLPEEGISF